MLAKVVSRELPGDLTLDCSIIRANVFIVKNLVLMTKKYSDRKNFEIAGIINTNIYTSTLEICGDREDNGTKKIESQLLGISKIIAARYHSKCGSSFENPLPLKSSRVRPKSTDKLVEFESICSILEDEMELFTLSDFQAMMEEQHENVYLLLMTKKKLQEKYKDEISFVTGSGKSDINSTLTEA